MTFSPVRVICGLGFRNDKAEKVSHSSEETGTVSPAVEAADRLRVALGRIAFALEKHKAEAAHEPEPVVVTAGPDLEAVVASVDALMLDVRGILAEASLEEHTSSTDSQPVPEEDPYGDDAQQDSAVAHDAEGEG
ncbi:hypothetical protein [Acetobacter estunensis]|uniref:hypothetical protein n=1 Tax=Acetobacter estunensis TaxID=104097 RepID=UPI001C2DA33A|nr:hypothetical protein [Acetobacter estunensis]MBV1838781.1 hypothetical protein [Acetobacter estunensis]